MTLEQIIKELSRWLEKYPKAKVTFNLEVGARKSVLLWSVYPEVYEDGGETYIVISNGEPGVRFEAPSSSLGLPA
jgi:hypothetical protein